MRTRLSLTIVLIGSLLGASVAASFASASGVVSGRVDFEDGSPAAGAMVVLTPGNYSAATLDDGSFRVLVPAGHFVVKATAGNDSATQEVNVTDGGVAVTIIRIVRAGFVNGPVNPVPFIFLIAAMAAVFVGGLYVNRRMAETGIDLNKSVLGGAQIRKPFRRRRRKAKPPAPPQGEAAGAADRVE